MKKFVNVIPLRPRVGSNAARGREMLFAINKRPRKAERLIIPHRATTAAAFQLIGRSCLHQLIASKNLISPGDPEALHQMRVALRRLRAALSTFSQIVADGKVAKIKRDLKWAGSVLGDARDKDVLIHDVLYPLRDERGDELGIGELVATSEEQRARAYRKAETAIGSPRFRRGCLAIAAWIEVGPWSTNSDDAARERRRRPIGSFAADELARRYEKVRKLGKHLHEFDVRGRHRFRIRIKKLRYATSFFSGLVKGKRNRESWGAALNSMKRLQDALGELNDIAESEAERSGGARSYSKSTRDSFFAAELLLRRQKGRVQPLKKAASKAYVELAAVRPFWT